MKYDIVVGQTKYFDAVNQAMHSSMYLRAGSLAAGDYDNDGKLDIARLLTMGVSVSLNF